MESLEGTQALYSFILSVVFTLIALFYAKRWHFFTLPEPLTRFPVTFLQTIGIFLTYFISVAFVLPILQIVILFFTKKDSLKELTPHLISWLQCVSLFIVFGILGLYCLLIKKESRESIFWGEKEHSKERVLKSLAMGAAGFLVSYPLMLLVGLGTNWIVSTLTGIKKWEQVAVSQLQLTKDNPLLFACMAVAVVFLVPIMEELLFRGFLQSWIKRYLPRRWALVAVALIFAIAHFAPSQKMGNITLIASLFTLALFLGFVYEKAQTLWAPIALHVIFNGISVLSIFFS